MPQLSTFHSQLSAFPAALPYNSELSLWLSVDPLSDKYPGSSPYVYCANNPVRLVDVDGREIFVMVGDKKCEYRGGQLYFGNETIIPEEYSFAEYVFGALQIMSSSRIGRTVIEALMDDSYSYIIKSKSDGVNIFSPAEGKRGGDVLLRSSSYKDVILRSLSHELFHGYQYLNGQGGKNIHNEVEAYMFEDIICSSLDRNYRSELMSRILSGATEPYKQAFEDFKHWDCSSVTAEKFDKVFTALTNGFETPAKANSSGIYNGIAKGNAASHLLRDILCQ